MLPTFSFSAHLSKGPKANPNRKIWVIQHDDVVVFIPTVRWDGTIKTLSKETCEQFLSSNR